MSFNIHSRHTRLQPVSGHINESVYAGLKVKPLRVILREQMKLKQGRLLPSYCNTRVKSQKSFVDYLTFTFRHDLDHIHDVREGLGNFHQIYNQDYLGLNLNVRLAHLLLKVIGLPEDEITLIPAHKAYRFYEYSIRLGQYGYVAFGGNTQNGTVLFELNGTGCAKVKDWRHLFRWAKANNVTITRLDLAYDDFEGKTVNIENALKWADDGLFNSNGRPPDTRLIDDRGSNKGKTVYVGERASQIFARIYEKGKQLKDKESPWVRFEVEFKKAKRELPLDMLIKPTVYLAGSYPCASFLSETQERIKSIKKQGRLLYHSLVEQFRTQYGRLLNVVLNVEGGDYVSVIEKLIRPGVPKSLQAFEDYLFPESEDWLSEYDRMGVAA